MTDEHAAGATPLPERMQPYADDGQGIVPIARGVPRRPALRHDREALTEIVLRLNENLSAADVVLWLISPHPALSNKHPIWCDVDEVRELLDGRTHDELLERAKVIVAKERV